MTKAFVYKDVAKSFPGFRLGPLDLELEPGTALGLIGPNGSGKTTTIQCLVGLLRPDSGEITVFGRKNDPDQRDWKMDIGYVGDIQVFYERWTGERNLRFLSRFYPEWSHDTAASLAARFRLPLDKRARDLSTGNRVKLSLVAALAHSPRLLRLDEPTAGVDPVARQEILDVLFEVLADGERAILYTTHILPEISRLVDRLAFIRDGSIHHQVAKEDLLENWRRLSFRCEGEIQRPDGAVAMRRDGEDFLVVSADARKTLDDLKQMGARNIRSTRMGMDEVAVHIMKGDSHVVAG